MDSSKLLNIGFKPKYKISNAIYELKKAFDNNLLMDNPRFHSIAWLKKLAKLGKIQ